jgi:hypothetical protein
MARTIILGGMSDDIHTLSVDGVKVKTKLHEFVVHLQVEPGIFVRATMEYSGEQWQCRITAPETTEVIVDQGPYPRDLSAQVIEIVRDSNKPWTPIQVIDELVRRGNSRERSRAALLELMEKDILIYTMDRELVLR